MVKFWTWINRHNLTSSDSEIQLQRRSIYDGIYFWSMAKKSPRTCVVAKRMQSNPTCLRIIYNTIPKPAKWYWSPEIASDGNIVWLLKANYIQYKWFCDGVIKGLWKLSDLSWKKNALHALFTRFPANHPPLNTADQQSDYLHRWP